MKTFCLLISIILACTEAAKILIVYPTPAKSHGILGDGYVRHLLNAGHEVSAGRVSYSFHMMIMHNG